MSCTNPNLMIPKRVGDEIEWKFIGNYRKTLNHGFEFLNTVAPDGEVLEPILVDCGKCLSCRQKQSTAWSARLQLEFQVHKPETCWFLTLTYDDDHLHFVENTDVPTLYPADVDVFLRHLRQRFGSFRYFYAGEYGSRTLRPHYHLLIFGLSDIPDLKVYSVSKGNTLFKSEVLNNVWRQGNIIIGSVSSASINYVSSYVTKKNHCPCIDGIVKPFHRMSRRPGIGAYSFMDPTLLNAGEHLYVNEGLTFDIPRYYAKKLEEEYPREYALYKKRLSDKSSIMKRCRPDVSELQNYIDKEYSAFRKAQINAERKGGDDL